MAAYMLAIFAEVGCVNAARSDACEGLASPTSSSFAGAVASHPATTGAPASHIITPICLATKSQLLCSSDLLTMGNIHSLWQGGCPVCCK